MGRLSNLDKLQLKLNIENRSIEEKPNTDEIELIKMIDDNKIILTNQIISFNNSCEYELVFEFFHVQFIKFSNYIQNIPRNYLL